MDKPVAGGVSRERTVQDKHVLHWTIILRSYLNYQNNSVMFRWLALDFVAMLTAADDENSLTKKTVKSFKADKAR